MTQQWYIQNSKIGHVKHPRLYLWTESWSNKWMPGTQVPVVLNDWRPKYVGLIINLAHVAKRPDLLRLNLHIQVHLHFPLLLSKFDFLYGSFSENYSNSPGIIIKWYISKMTKTGCRICLNVPYVKIDRKILKRSVLNGQSKFASHYA